MGVDPKWTGDYDQCRAGSIAGPYRDAVLRLINFARVLAGVPGDVVLDPTFNRDAQASALISGAQGALSHTPDNSFACFSEEGANGSLRSNISLHLDADPHPRHRRLHARLWGLQYERRSSSLAASARAAEHGCRRYIRNRSRPFPRRKCHLRRRATHYIEETGGLAPRRFRARRARLRALVLLLSRSRLQRGHGCYDLGRIAGDSRRSRLRGLETRLRPGGPPLSCGNQTSLRLPPTAPSSR